jgi:hypothetical protein
MRKHNEFRPVAVVQLEDRIVLNHSGFRNPSVLVGGLTPRVQGIGRHNPQPILALINKAFDSFVQDYTQARAAYLSTLNQPTTTSGTGATDAFKNYTRYRVELLANQVVSSALQTSISQVKQHGSGWSVPALVGRRLDGVTSATDQTFRNGTLGSALTSTIPSSQTGPAAAALDSLAQDQAIAAARVAILNGLNIAKNNDFGNTPSN